MMTTNTGEEMVTQGEEGGEGLNIMVEMEELTEAVEKVFQGGLGEEETDISGFTFSSWNIGPGEGGDVEYQREQFGGGGGGVLVDGANQVTCKNLTDLKGLTQNLLKNICLRF